ncbi:MAG TPA: class I SAM-dependent methyltransferase [Nocardioidaceae bacterium]|nr:class I SAM-dependent methyltransferase [Nocardioidaceae bacterium]
MPDDVYTHGHSESVLRSHRWRTLENSAGYLVPYLDEDADVLDVGCGPGTITLDLARAVTRGRVTGLDRSAVVLSEASKAAEEAGLVNVEFQCGDVYSLAFDDDSFDVVHAHQVLQHLSEPVEALREMGRVCRPDGAVAARDADYAAFTWWPEVPELDEWLGLYRAVARSNGAEPDAGRRVRSWARRAGLEVVASTADVWCFSSPDDVAWWGGLWADRVQGSAMAEQAKERGMAGDEDLERLAAGWRAWSTSPDAWFVVVHGEVVCRPAPSGTAP